MNTWFWYLLGAAVLAGIIEAMFSRRLPKCYRRRSCMGRSWRDRFPLASKSDIRRFLDIFCEAFLFGGAHRLKFGPDDKVIDIYKALYPSNWVADALETVVLLRLLEEEYRVEFPESFDQAECTLGEIFEFVTQKSQQ